MKETEVKRLIIAADVNALDMKRFLITHILAEYPNIQLIDIEPGDGDDAPIYPHTVRRACLSLLGGGMTPARAILICGTGIGVSITANKFEGIYAALCHDKYSCERSILSNNANVICFGAQIISPEFAVELTDLWLGLTYRAGTRSEPKVEAIKEVEAFNFNHR